MPRNELRTILSADARKFNRNIGKAKKIAGGFAKAVVAAGVAGGVALAVMTKKTADLADNMGKMAKRTGLTVKELQELQNVAMFTGNTADDVEKTIKRMSVSIGDLREGLSTTQKQFKKLNLTAEDFKNKSPKESYDLIVKSLANIADETERSNVSQKIFGRAGTGILAQLADGYKEYEKVVKRARRIPTFSAKQIANAEAFNDTFGEVSKTIKTQFGGAILDALPEAEKLIINIGNAIDEMAGGAGEIVDLTALFKKLNEGIIAISEGGGFQSIGEGIKSVVGLLRKFVNLLQKAADLLVFTETLRIDRQSRAKNFQLRQSKVGALTGEQQSDIEKRLLQKMTEIADNTKGVKTATS
jgi:hypothetical protein